MINSNFLLLLCHLWLATGVIAENIFAIIVGIVWFFIYIMGSREERARGEK